MADAFLEIYLLSLFSKQTRVTRKQLKLISQGRRTPSVLFTIEKNKLHPLFTLFPKWEEKDWLSLVQTLLSKQLLGENEKVLFITDKGIKTKEVFQEKYPQLNTIRTLENNRARHVFWNRVLFISQIISEYNYKNKYYYPYVTSVNRQYSTKVWLKEQQLTMAELTDQWTGELSSFLETLPSFYAECLVDHMMGHNHPGLTKRQIMEKYGLTHHHYRIQMSELIELFIQSTRKRKGLFQGLWKDVHLEEKLGLSNSTFETFKAIEKGQTIQSIAQRRSLKENTIKEHVLEMVLISDWKKYKYFIPDNWYDTLHEFLNENENTSYAEAKKEYEHLEFFWYRLIEIERIRMNDSFHT